MKMEDAVCQDASLQELPRSRLSQVKRNHSSERPVSVALTVKWQDIEAILLKRSRQARATTTRLNHKQPCRLADGAKVDIIGRLAHRQRLHS